MKPFGYRAFLKEFKKHPNKTVVSVICENKPDPGSTLGAAFDYAKKKYKGPIHKLTKIQLLSNRCGTSIKQLIEKITFADVKKEIIDPISSESRKIEKAGTFVDVLRFFVDGVNPVHFSAEGRWGKKPSDVMSSQNGIEPEESTDTVKIKHQIISEEEALDLIKYSRGGNSEFRFEIKAQLMNLPPGQAYAFKPKISEGQKLGNYKQWVSQTLTELREKNLDFTFRYIKPKQIFVVIRTKAYKKGDK